MLNFMLQFSHCLTSILCLNKIETMLQKNKQDFHEISCSIGTAKNMILFYKTLPFIDLIYLIKNITKNIFQEDLDQCLANYTIFNTYTLYFFHTIYNS